MTREEFKSIIRLLLGAYKNRFEMNQGDFDVWYEVFSDLDYNTLRKATMEHIKQSKYVPTPADIKEQYNHIVSENDKVMERLKEDYNRITGLYPDGHSPEAWEAYMSLIKSAKGNPFAVSDRIAYCVSKYISTAKGDVPSLAEFIRGLRCDSSRNRSDKRTPN